MDLSIDPVAFITTECITVTSAMRKNTRWAASSTASILGQSTANAKRTQKYLAQREGAKKKKGRDSSGGIAGGPNGTGTATGTGLGTGADDEGGEEVPVKRWGLRPDRSKTVKPNPLMSAFARLRGDLKGCRDIHDFDVPALLHPFLQVIRSSSTSASITAFALIAITKFFSYRIIQAGSPRLAQGMQLLSAAITHCRFEASETTADEYVLQLILELMEDMLSGPGGELLGDESVCEMMETGLSMCCQSRLSEQLRRLAERKMVTMCQTIFERLKTLEADDELEPPEALPIRAADSSAHMEAPLQSTNLAPASRGTPLAQSSSATVDSDMTREASTEGRLSVETAAAKKDATPRPSSEPASEAQKTDNTKSVQQQPAKIKPYSLPSIRELFRVLVNLLEPEDKQHTDAMRVMALRIIDVAIEVAGTSIARHPSLASLARDDLCRNLFQLVRTENMFLLNESLRVAGTLLATCRPALKLQQELYLSYLVACLHPKIGVPHDDNIDPALYDGVPQAPKLVKSSQPGSGRATPVPVQERQRLGLEGGTRRPEAREAMVENLGALARIPTFMTELFVNYDCEIDRVDLCEEFISLLARNAFPDAANWSTKNVPPLCLDSLLTHVQFVHDRLDLDVRPAGLPDAEALQRQRATKKIVIAGASRFNTKPKDGLAWLAEQGIIPSVTDWTAIARFLRGTGRINKTVLGEFLSKKGNEELLTAYIDEFDFMGKRIDEALRMMLNTFRLPGESALIERIVVKFADKYMKSSETTDIADGDSGYVLVYAIIMLNTDQHNPNVRADKRMTQEAFARNLRGVNAGKDFDAELLQSIFETIRTNEIILPDEHDNKHAFEYAWKELLLKTETSGDLVIGNTNIYDADMFEATWKPVLAVLCYVFMSATEDAVYERVIVGFEQCAEIAARYNLRHILDHIIFCLATMSTLATDSIPSTALNTEVMVNKRSIMVSEMAVKFGRLPKAQLAAVVLFAGVVQGHEATIKSGWSHVAKIWLNLFANSQLPPLPEALTITPDLPVLPVRTPGKVIDKDQQAQSAGLFSSFTSLISAYAADEPNPPSDEEISDTIRAIECLAECQFEQILASIPSLPAESLISLIHALLEQLPQDNDPVVAVVKPEPIPPNAARPNTQQRQSPPPPTYNPTVAYILELASVVIIQNKAALEATGKEVVEALRDVLRNGGSSHPIVLSRAIFYLMHILSVSHEHSFVRAPVILHTIDSLTPAVLDQSAVPILKGLAQCLSGPRPLRNEVINTPDFWFIVRRLGQNAEVAGEVFAMLKDINDDSDSAVTADNYEVVVLALNDFASAGSAGALLEQARDKARRTRQQQNQQPPVKPLDVKGNEFVSRGIQAIAMIYKLSGRVPSLIERSNLARGEAWASYWTPIFRSLSTQCTNPCRELRHHAFGGLQRALLSPDAAAGNAQAWRAMFDDTLFPLVMTLLKPEVFHTDPAGMPETRVQASGLLCRVFLNYLGLLAADWPALEELWLRILDVMDRLMNSGQPADAQVEALHESLKNTLLVMANGAFLSDGSHGGGGGDTPASPDAKQASDLWTKTRAKLDRFQPDMAKEIFPDEKAGGGAAGAAGRKAPRGGPMPKLSADPPAPTVEADKLDGATAGKEGGEAGGEAAVAAGESKEADKA